jgi:hypothetical protein
MGSLYTATMYCVQDIAGHRHQGRCCLHQHSGILYLIPVLEHSDIGLVTLILLLDWFLYRHFCSFRYWTPDDVQSGILAFKIHFTKVKRDTCTLHNLTASNGPGYTPCTFTFTAVGGKGYTLHVHTAGGYTLHAHTAESVATLPPFSPIEGQKWFDQISSQRESQKNRFAFIYFGKIQFLPPCI